MRNQLAFIQRSTYSQNNHSLFMKGLPVKKNALVALSAFAVLGLAACGGSNSEPAQTPDANAQESPAIEQPAPSASEPMDGEASNLVSGDDFFFVSTSNAVGKFTLPTDAPADIEKLRTASGGEEVTYALVQIDNREGMDYANMYAMNVYGADGSKYEFSGVDNFLDEWRNNVEHTVANNDLNADLVDAINHHQEGVDAGMVGEIWMATEAELPDEFAQITVEVHGAGSPDNAVSQKDSQGIDLTFEVPEKNKK